MFSSHEQGKLDEMKQKFQERGYLIQQSELDLKKAVGRGAAGPTYLGTYRGRNVAVKKYSKEVLSQDLPSVMNEMKFMLELEHENIVPFQGIVLEFSPPTVMLVSLFAVNGDLLVAIHGKKIIRKMSLEEKVKLTMGIAKGMEYVHQNGVIHRDIKCANILLSSELTPWIADFGFSRLLDPVNTMTGETGSYRYMAPEVIKASKYSTKADIYSFAVCVNELFTNEQPFAGTQPFEAAKNVALHAARPDYRKVPNLTLQKLIRACWQTNEDRRPGWPLIIGVLQEVLDDLEDAKRKGEEPGQSTGRSGSSRTSQDSRARQTSSRQSRESREWATNRTSRESANTSAPLETPLGTTPTGNVAAKPVGIPLPPSGQEPTAAVDAEERDGRGAADAGGFRNFLRKLKR